MLLLEQIPELVRRRAETTDQLPWLTSLPELVAGLERDWDITVGAPVSGGSESLIAPATMADGTEAMLKVRPPGDATAAEREIAILAAVAGDGCAALLRADLARCALVTERLGEMLGRSTLPLKERVTVLVDNAQRLWRHRPEVALPTGAEKARWLIDYIEEQWAAQSRPCSERALRYALNAAHRRLEAHDDARSVLVHGDVHEQNTLRASDGTYKLIDPEGYWAEPECELGIIVRLDFPIPPGGDHRHWARLVAERTGTDIEATWQWASVERISSALMGRSLGMTEWAAGMFAAAEQAAAAEA